MLFEGLWSGGGEEAGPLIGWAEHAALSARQSLSRRDYFCSNEMVPQISAVQSGLPTRQNLTYSGRRSSHLRFLMRF